MDQEGTEVDALLALSESPDREEVTGIYDLNFFGLNRPKEAPVDAHRLMEDARIGLNLFLEEASRALETDDLTIDQRCHVATIVSYIEALGTRFDRVRVEGFTQSQRTRTGT